MKKPKSKFRISAVEYFTDFVLAPAVAFLALNAFGFYFLPVVAGFLGWTAVEYGLHRWLFHRTFRRDHWVHHLEPESYVGVSPLKTWPLFGGLGLVLWLTCGAVAGSLYAGFLLGYTTYIVVHWAMHHDVIHSRGPLGFLKRSHDRHHAGIEANYGVTSPLWDWVFGTRQRVG